MTKVLLIVPLTTLDWGSKNAGGVDSVCQIIVEQITKFGNEDFYYRVLAFDPLNEATYSGQVIHLSDNVEVVVSPIKEKLFGLPVSSLFSSNRRVLQQVNIFKPDIVHSHQAIWLLGAFKTNVRISTIHSYKKLGRKSFSWLNNFVYELVLPKITNAMATEFTVVGECLRFELNPDTKKKITLIENPISNNFFCVSAKNSANNKTLRLVTCALIKRQKRVHLSVELLSKIVKLGHNAVLTVIGPNSDELYYSDLKNVVSELGMEKRVTFKGNCPQNEIIEIYNNSDLGIFLSEEETFGLAPLEMIAAGLPLIASKVGVLKERFSEFSNFNSILIFEHADTNVMANEALPIFDKSCKPAIEYINDNFSASNIIIKYEIVYREAIR